MARACSAVFRRAPAAERMDVARRDVEAALGEQPDAEAAWHEQTVERRQVWVAYVADARTERRRVERLRLLVASAGFPYGLGLSGAPRADWLSPFLYFGNTR